MKDSLDILCTGDYIEHHGIKGMHWGIRRFQPYPGDYTGGGKYIGKAQKKEYKNAKRSQSLRYMNNYDRMKKYSKDNKVIKEAGEKLQPLADKIFDTEFEIDNYRENLPTAIRNKIAKTALTEAIKEAKRIDPEYGHQGERYDNKLIEMLLTEGNFEDTAERNYLKNDPKYKKLRDEKLKARKEYKEALKNITNDIVGEYGDEKIHGLGTDMSYRDLVAYSISDQHLLWSFTSDEKMGRR